MKVFTLKKQDEMSELDYLEQIYKKVRVGELVKFNGKAFARVIPKNNKYNKNPYHFCLSTENIYDGNILLRDDDGEMVRLLCLYKVELSEG